MDSEIHAIFSGITECFKITEKNKPNGIGPLGLSFILSVFLHPQFNVPGCKLVFMGRTWPVKPERRVLLKELEFRG